MKNLSLIMPLAFLLNGCVSYTDYMPQAKEAILACEEIKPRNRAYLENKEKAIKKKRKHQACLKKHLIKYKTDYNAAVIRSAVVNDCVGVAGLAIATVILSPVGLLALPLCYNLLSELDE